MAGTNYCHKCHINAIWTSGGQTELCYWCANEPRREFTKRPLKRKVANKGKKRSKPRRGER